jgi:hypothetical protein
MSFFRYKSILSAWAGILALATHPQVVAAQSVNWTAPSSGYLHDHANHTIRPISGFVGAAVLGAAVLEGVDWASMAPDQRSALTLRDGLQVWIPNLASSDAPRRLDLVPEIQQVFWAADSRQMALLVKGPQLIWLLDSPDLPVPVSAWNLQNPDDMLNSQTSWRLLAADTAADKVLLVSRTRDIERLWLASRGLAPFQLEFSGSPAAAAFTLDGGVFVADAIAQRIVSIRNLEGNPVQAAVLAAELSLKDTAALAVSADGQRLFVADRADRVVRVFGLSGGNLIAECPTDWAPESLTRVGVDRFLVGTSASDVRASTHQPYLFLDSGTAFRISFVPRAE